MIPSDASPLGTRLDDHHAPETNGRMSVCRRCGSRTDGPTGRRHQPSERQLARSDSWLAAQAHQTLIAGARASRALPISTPTS
jgi:hypothetical protein